MKSLIKKQLKSQGITLETFCERNGFDYSNFTSKTVNKMERDINKARDVLNKLDIEIILVPKCDANNK